MIDRLVGIYSGASPEIKESVQKAQSANTTHEQAWDVVQTFMGQVVDGYPEAYRDFLGQVREAFVVYRKIYVTNQIAPDQARHHLEKINDGLPPETQDLIGPGMSFGRELFFKPDPKTRRGNRYHN